MEESKLERNAVRSLLLLSKEPLSHFTAQSEVDRWEPLRELNANAPKPPRPNIKRVRKPQARTERSDKSEVLASIEPVPTECEQANPHISSGSREVTASPSIEERSLPTTEETINLTEDQGQMKENRRASIDITIVQMPPPAVPNQKRQSRTRRIPISITPIVRHSSLSVKDVQRVLSENSRKYRVTSEDKRLVRLRGKLSFRNYVALKT